MHLIPINKYLRSKIDMITCLTNNQTYNHNKTVYMLLVFGKAFIYKKRLCLNFLVSYDAKSQ